MADRFLDSSLDQLSPATFQRLAVFIQRYCGIKLPTSKKTMVESRLRRRVRACGLNSLDEYTRFILDQGGWDDECVDLVDAITTNKTDFFREPVHFDYLAEKAVPEMFASRVVSRQNPLKAWSAACSTGAEPYTIAMVLADLAAANNFRFSILGTDICLDVLNTAVEAIYSETLIEPVPMAMRRRYLLRGKAGGSEKVRVVPELRQVVQFARLNLMETPYNIPTDMHVIFCRNVLIYFEKPAQHKVLEQLCHHLRPGGYLFLGHSESLSGARLPLTQVATTVFRKA